MIKFNKHPCILSSYISQSFPFAADSTEKESRDKFWAEFFKLFLYEWEHDIIERGGLQICNFQENFILTEVVK